ncbi:lipopolysaccharide core heptose(II)-phosphate phosphatase [Salmonella enterica subsp. enterica serovar Hadar]|nr:lipopolysaccharide core heptose(II)-phosphate phosphatase [Salmonella enterica subsp. enterica serovar Hadar]
MFSCVVRRLRFSGPKTSIICSPMTSLKTSIKTITYLSDIGCLEIQGASLASLINADNTVIFLFRHGERCDRSDMPCYSDKSGITITGTEKAQQEGIKFATIFSEYDIYSSNAVRTIQTAKFFSGKEPVVMDSLSDCNNDLYKTLESIARESHKRNIVIMTHNHCLSFLARDRLGKKFKPAYLDALIMHYDGTRLILDGKYNKEA